MFTLKDIIDKVEEVSGEKRHQNNIKRDLMAMGAIIETSYKVKVKNGRPPHLFVRNPDFYMASNERKEDHVNQRRTLTVYEGN